MAECFWTELVKVEEDCGEGPPAFTFSALGDNNVTTVTLLNAPLPWAIEILPTSGPPGLTFGDVYNAQIYFEIETFGWFSEYGAQYNTYEGGITGVSLNQYSLAGSLLDSTSLSDITLNVIDYANGNMFEGFGGTISGMPVLTAGSYWQVTGTINLTDSEEIGTPATGAFTVNATQGPEEVFSITHPGGQDPNPLPFLRLSINEEAEEIRFQVQFADTGGYACGVLGDADFTVDGVPYTQIDFENFCS